MCIVPLVVFTRVAREIACLHADLASTAITRETRKACFSLLSIVITRETCKSEFLVVAFYDNILYTIPDS